MSRRTDRKGIALATVMFALVVIGVLIAGTFFATTQEYRVARNSLTSQKALAAAEYGQNQILNDWNTTWPTTMLTGDTIKRTYPSASGAGTVDSVIMTRLRFNMFSVVSTGYTGTMTSDDARRRTGLLIRLDMPEIPFPGAFSGAKTSAIAGNFSASGNDSIPAGWTDCPPAGPQKAAIAATSSANVAISGGCSGGTCLTGSPKVLSDANVADTTKVLDAWADLVSQANIVIVQSGQTLTGMAPAYSGGNCDMTVSTNWGDPSRNATPGKCENYFPVIYLKSAVKGALGPLTTITTGVGQGIILVDGNLAMAGNINWVGPIIVRGNVALSGNGNKTVGGIQALNLGCVTASCNSLSGTSSATYSSCTINKILAMKAKPALASKHAWADMF
jgi:hypothetical protein